MFRIIGGLITLVTASASATLPLYFEPNRGQANSHVEFLSRGNGVTSYLAGGVAAFSVGGSSIVMRLVGASAGRAEACDRLPGQSSYFTGGTRSTWHTGIPQFGKVIYRGVYPGIDLVFYGANGALEYDFQIAPGADPAVIQIAYEGAARVRVDGGDLLLAAGNGEIRQRRPVVYQQAGAKRRPVEAWYRVDGNRVGIRVAGYDRRAALVVDPVIEYATYFGGAGMDSANAVKVDSSGNVYIAGSLAMPATTANPFVPASANSYDSTAAVIKYSPSQKAIVYTAQIGADAQNSAGRLDVDAAGALYVTGSTNSTKFPLVNATDQANVSGSYTPFVTKIAADGSTLLFSTYFGGTGLDQYGDIAAGPNGEAYVTGTAAARDFPVTDSSVNASDGPKAFLAKFNTDGTLAFSRLFGGPGSTGASRIALDSSGNLYIVGSTSSTNFPAKNAFQSISLKDPLLASMILLRSAFAAKFASDGKTMIYATLLGGTGDDAANSAAVDSQGNLYLAGMTTSIDLPVLNPVQSGLAGMQNGFLAELNPQGSGLSFLTYFGGSKKDSVRDLALDANGNIYLTGETTSADFPVLNATASTKAKSSSTAPSAFAAKLAPGGRGILFSTMLGGSKTDIGYGIASDTSGAAYLVGLTTSSDLPVTSAFQSAFGGAIDMFLAKIAPDSAPVSPIVALPASLSFTVTVGGTAPAPQVINLTMAGGATASTFTATASVASGGNWLSITPGTGSVPGQIAVSVSTSGAAVGVYSGTVQITPPSGPAAVVPVVLHVIPPTPQVTSVTPAQFDAPQFDVLNPPSTLPTVTLTISGSGFVSGATAWVTAIIPDNTVAYPTTFVDANTLQASIPLNLQAGLLTLKVSNPGTPQSNPVNLMEGKPAIGAAHVTGTVAPGQIVVISGFNVGPVVPYVAPSSGPPLTTLGNAQVLFDGVPAQLVAAYWTQVRAVVPANVAGETSTKIVVKYFDQSSVPLTVATAGNPPPPDPLGPGISGVLNPDGSINSASNPTSVGAVVMLVIDISQVPADAAPASVTVGGINAPLVPMQDVVGRPGKMQLQIQIPAGAPSGSAIPIVVQFQNSNASAHLGVAIQ